MASNTRSAGRDCFLAATRNRPPQRTDRNAVGSSSERGRPAGVLKLRINRLDAPLKIANSRGNSRSSENRSEAYWRTRARYGRYDRRVKGIKHMEPADYSKGNCGGKRTLRRFALCALCTRAYIYFVCTPSRVFSCRKLEISIVD